MESETCDSCGSRYSDSLLRSISRFNRYLVFFGPGEEGSGVKGIRADAPDDVIEEFFQWYRDRNRYENGRLKPLSKAARERLIIRERGPDGDAHGRARFNRASMIHPA